MARGPHQREGAQRQPGEFDDVVEIDTGDIEAVDLSDFEPLAPPVGPAVLPPTRILPSDPQRAVPTSIYAPERFEAAPSAETKLLALDSESDEEEASEEEETTVEAKPPPPVTSPSRGPLLEPAFLIVEKGPGAGRSLPLFEGEMAIGRSSTCSVQVPLPSISRHHATLVRQGNHFVLRDEGSHNGTFVNGRQVTGELELRSGDEIAIGKASLVLRAGTTDPGQLTSTSVAVPDRPWMKLAIFGGAMALGILTVFAMAGLRGGSGPVQEASDPAARAPAAQPEPHAAEPVRAVAPAAADPSAPAFGDEAIEDLSAEEIYEEARGDERLAEIEVPRRPVERRPPRRTAKAKPTRGTADSAAARVRYESGDVEGAIVLARKAGADDLAADIANFKKEQAAAKAALSFKDGAGAIRHFGAALALDREITEGTSKQGREIRAQLSRLYQVAGTKEIERGDVAKAAAYLDRAVKYDGTNEAARELLSRLKSGSTAAAQNAADQAFGP